MLFYMLTRELMVYKNPKRKYRQTLVQLGHNY